MGGKHFRRRSWRSVISANGTRDVAYGIGAVFVLTGVVTGTIITSNQTSSDTPRTVETASVGYVELVPSDTWAVPSVATPQPPATAPSTSSPSTTTTTSVTTTTVPPTSVPPHSLPTVTVIHDYSIAPGKPLLSEETCAARVVPTREYRTSNSAANKVKPSSKPSLDPKAWGSNSATGKYVGRISGNYTGTTDEIIQWASCKWGFDTEITRAQIMVESSWRQNATAGSTDDQSKCVGEFTVPCPLAFGLLQIRTDQHVGTYPYSATSTAFNVDYSLAMRRACYDGFAWLGPQAKGDLWGCVGVHRSGKLNDELADSYVALVQQYLMSRPWLKF